MTEYISQGRKYLRVKYRDYFTEDGRLYFYEILNDRYDECIKPYDELKKLYLGALTD
jgi:hypothetical protein